MTSRNRRTRPANQEGTAPDLATNFPLLVLRIVHSAYAHV